MTRTKAQILITFILKFEEQQKKQMESPIFYTNRKGDKSYLKKSVTKTGKVRYVATKKARKVDLPNFLTVMPEGLEFYENPVDGVVKIREIKASVFSDEEKKVVDELFHNEHLLKAYVEQETISFYFPNDNNFLAEEYFEKELSSDHKWFVRYSEYLSI